MGKPILLLTKEAATNFKLGSEGKNKAESGRGGEKCKMKPKPTTNREVLEIKSEEGRNPRPRRHGRAATEEIKKTRGKKEVRGRTSEQINSLRTTGKKKEARVAVGPPRGDRLRSKKNGPEKQGFD